MRDAARGRYPNLETLLRDVIEPEWRTARQIWNHHAEHWELASVRHALRLMADRHECQARQVTITPIKSVNEYRRNPKKD